MGFKNPTANIGNIKELDEKLRKIQEDLTNNISMTGEILADIRNMSAQMNINKVNQTIEKEDNSVSSMITFFKEDKIPSIVEASGMQRTLTLPEVKMAKIASKVFPNGEDEIIKINPSEEFLDSTDNVVPFKI